MKSNYRRIGDFIELVDERNKNLSVTTLLGLSISKEFIPSVANTVGTNMKNYKIIRRGQFACSVMQVRRDKKMPVALLKDYDEAIISQAYPVFQIKDKNELLPEYLMMWFSRSEFDREACFYAVGGVRGSLEWEDFEDMQLPVPSMESQKEIVKEYNTVVNHIKLNEQFNKKLEETAQTLYKHWFVDFEFPAYLSGTLSGAEGYKSSGGKMVYNAELDKEIPIEWEVMSLDNFCDCLDNLRKPLSGEERDKIPGAYPYYGAMSIIDYIDDFIYDGIFLLVSEDGANVVDKKGRPATQYVWGKFWLNNHAHIIKGKDSYSTEFLKVALSFINASHLVTGAAQPKINQRNLMSINLLKSNDKILNSFDNLIQPIFKRIVSNSEEIRLLKETNDLLLSKMTRIKAEKEMVNL
ncbi:restriction endonuclease subunit S [Muricauda sp. SCSIO 64092]|uniref:restriction endonuclease subunit S n=1 Tax=Allomuricauda sp. SCSIO 64092 TaxID=2908842 RepID=UPI001FF31A1D|nr:restriction endonuclease subunit S [Muricauda sp. SCSIO 64092]UOY08227.1 restriction endonuclease subunit S [Muricauda sp. SCSIO 64092]